MKKLIFGLIATVVFGFVGNAQNSTNDLGTYNVDNLYASNELPIVSSNFNSSVNNNNVVVRKWWATAIVDASGAIGGAAAGAQFINIASATPWGWAAIGGCALICGAGASLAKVGNVKPNDNNIKGLSNELNEFDWVGVKHNLIINDYFENYLEYNPEDYYNFIVKNKDKYEIKDVYITKEYLEKQFETVKNINTDEDVYEYALSNLPEEVNKEDFKKFLINLSTIDSNDEFIETVKVYENKLIQSKLSDETKIQLSTFFSTLRYSKNLW